MGTLKLIKICGNIMNVLVHALCGLIIHENEQNIPKGIFNKLEAIVLSIFPDVDAVKRLIEERTTTDHRGILHSYFLPCLESLYTLLRYKNVGYGLKIGVSHLVIDLIGGGPIYLPGRKIALLETKHVEEHPYPCHSYFALYHTVVAILLGLYGRSYGRTR